MLIVYPNNGFLSSVSVLCQLNICLLCSLTVNSVFFCWVSSLWPTTILIFYAFGHWLHVIKDLCFRVIKSPSACATRWHRRRDWVQIGE